MKREINSISDLRLRMQEIEIENEHYISEIKTDLTDINTYLPNALKRNVTLDALSESVNTQLNHRGFKLGLLLPIVLNNTLFKSKGKATKTLIAALALVLDDNLTYRDIKKALKKIFGIKKKKKKGKVVKVGENPIIDEPTVVPKK